MQDNPIIIILQSIQTITTMSTTKSNNQDKQVNENRSKLIELSASIKAAQEIGQFPCFETVNAALLYFYRLEAGNQALEFKTFLQWKEEGFKVKKGEKAYYVWGSKREAKKTNEETGEEKDFRFFPTCALFSSDQVEEAQK